MANATVENITTEKINNIFKKEHKNIINKMFDRTNKTPPIIVFDLDECLGSFKLPGWIYYTAKKYYNKTITFPNADLDKVMQEGLQSAWLRPGIENIFKIVDYHRKCGDINKICIFTNASNEQEWVEYIVKQISLSVEIPELFDVIVSRDSEERTIVDMKDYNKYGGIPPKFLIDIIRKTGCSIETPIIMFDDRTCNIVPHIGIKKEDSIEYIIQNFHLEEIPAYDIENHILEDYNLLFEFIEDYMQTSERGLASFFMIGMDIRESERAIENVKITRQTYEYFLPPLIAKIMPEIIMDEKYKNNNNNFLQRIKKLIVSSVENIFLFCEAEGNEGIKDKINLIPTNYSQNHRLSPLFQLYQLLANIGEHQQSLP